MSSAAPDTIAADLPCAGCKYNLRGLPPTSNCPECGRPAVDSVDAAIERNERAAHRRPVPLTAAPATLLRQWREGAILHLVGIGLLAAVLSFTPDEAWRFRDPARPYLLGGLVAAWVVCWRATDKLARSDPADPGGRHALRRFVRAAGWTYLALPFAWSTTHRPMRLTDLVPEPLLIAVAALFVAAVPVTCVGAWAVILGILGRADRTSRVFAALVVIPAVAATLFGLLPDGRHRGVDSVSLMVDVPWPLVGPPDRVASAARPRPLHGFRLDDRDFFLVPPLLAAGCCIAVVVATTTALAARRENSQPRPCAAANPLG